MEKPAGTINAVAVSDDQTKVTVTGQASAGVNAVAVLIGPRPGNASQYWAAGEELFSERSWSVVVATDPHLPANYQVKAYFNSNSGLGYFPLSQQTIQEAIECGEPCLGPPAVYAR